MSETERLLSIHIRINVERAKRVEKSDFNHLEFTKTTKDSMNICTVNRNYTLTIYMNVFLHTQIHTKAHKSTQYIITY